MPRSFSQAIVANFTVARCRVTQRYQNDIDKKPSFFCSFFRALDAEPLDRHETWNKSPEGPKSKSRQHRPA
jgi:hypothetical protein